MAYIQAEQILRELDMEKIIDGFMNDDDYILLGQEKNTYIFKVVDMNKKMIIIFDESDNDKMSISFEDL